MFLHIMPASRYTIDYVNRINKLYHPQEHFFVIYGCNTPDDYSVQSGIIVNKVDDKTRRTIWRMAHKARHIYLQSLYLDKRTLMLVTILSLILPGRFSWYVWSADLIYEHELECQIKGLMLKRRIKKLCRRIVIKRLYQIIVTAPSDYKYALYAYKTNAKGRIAYYAYQLPGKEIVEEAIKHNNPKLLVGHSASPRTKHKEIYKFIAQKGYRGEVVSILSYGGDEEYIKEVIENGKDYFGNRFTPITEWMSYGEYVHLLTEINAAVIPADRQNGAGNIMYLLFLGKKVFLHKKNGSLDYLRQKNVRLFELEDISDKNISEQLKEEEIKRNQEIIRELCSDENFKREWDIVFDVPND